MSHYKFTILVPKKEMDGLWEMFKNNIPPQCTGLKQQKVSIAFFIPEGTELNTFADSIMDMLPENSNAKVPYFS